MNGFDVLGIFINEMEKLQIEEKYASSVITNKDMVKIKKAYEVISSSKVSPEMIYEMIVEE